MFLDISGETFNTKLIGNLRTVGSRASGCSHKLQMWCLPSPTYSEVIIHKGTEYECEEARKYYQRAFNAPTEIQANSFVGTAKNISSTPRETAVIDEPEGDDIPF